MAGGTAARGGPPGGRLIVIAGPSGVGKGTVVRRLLQVRPDLVLSVSCTTRAPRRGEVEGRDYRFLSVAEFDRLVADGAFLEWADVFGDRKGTLEGPVREAMARGADVVLEIDVQGAAIVRRRVPEALLIFLVPPSRAELERRLRARRTEDGETLERRLAAAERELAEAPGFDRVVVNDEVDRAAAEIAGILDC